MNTTDIKLTPPQAKLLDQIAFGLHHIKPRQARSLAKLTELGLVEWRSDRLYTTAAGEEIA